MNTKRVVSFIICAAMLLVMVPGAVLFAGAANMEGQWTTYRTAGEYDDPNAEFDPNAEPSVYKPEAGYIYTDEGFSVVPADYKDTTPFMTVQTKEKQCLKDGIYLQFRVDDYSYDGGSGADQWICISLNTEEKVEPGNPQFGGNWLTLVKGSGGGMCTSVNSLTDPRTEDFGGTFKYIAAAYDVPVPMDDEGREVYTFEVKWNGAEYAMYLNDVLQPAAAEATKMLEKLDSSGMFYVGVTMMSIVKDGTAALTILKYGTSKADATTPTGSDEKKPEENEITLAPIGDPKEVGPNKPAILWSPSTWGLGGGTNCTAYVKGDNTWAISGTEYAVCLNFTPRRSWSWAAEDFPVFGILVRNFPAENGQLWYAAGDIMNPHNDYKTTFSIYDGEIYKDNKGNEYIFIPADLSGMWEGRINCIRMDVGLPDPDSREYDICFAGMFRSYEEGVAYVENYFASNNILDPNETRETQTDTSVPTDVSTEPATEPSIEAPSEVTTNAAATEPAAKSGCSSTIGFGAIVICSAIAAAVALKVKKN